jgi:galactose mutarotase-like enzyme
MSQIFIENNFLKVGINQVGAEFASLQSKIDGTEYLWQADPTFWGRHSCILFPYIGKVWEDKFRIGEKTFEGKQHGFARNLPFEEILVKKDKITFQLKHNKKILDEYPYKFSLLMKYVLEKNQLHIIYEVENLDDQPIHFSLGAHPAFNVPLNENEKRSDYFLEFEKDEFVETLELTNGYLNGNSRDVFNGKNTIQITDDLFNKDALIFKDFESNYLTLKNSKNEKIWTFTFEDFPYLGIWSKNDKSPFVCIEPWLGVADEVNADWDFRKKEGIVELGIGEKFSCKHSVIIH